MTTETSIQDFKAALLGELLQPGNAGYDEARKIYNSMIDKHPRLIARCEDVADVILAVNYARDNNLVLAVKAGGHSAPGLSVCDDGLVIDLTHMNGIRVNKDDKTVRVEGGCTLGALDHATHAFGLAVPCGVISTTGIGGLTLGGGSGYLTRKYGLSIDNLLEADMVLADGSFVTASEDKHEDLFWAIRGGGGNFGVVTSFLFQAHPVSMDYAGPMLWELDQVKPVMQWYRDFMLDAPEDLYGFFAFLQVPPGEPFPEAYHNKKMGGIIWCYSGDMDKAEKVFEPIRNLVPKPAIDLVGPIPHPALQGMFDPLFPPGHQWYMKGDFITEIPDEAIDQHIAFARKIPTLLSGIHLYPINGAAHKVKEDATAWAFREANWSQVIIGVDPDPKNKDKIIEWARAYHDAIHPYAAGGAYVNFLMDEGEERIKDTYRGNYDKLARIKYKYDPDNLFRMNQNIKPLATA
ncbi:FAD-binding oxidoreductase [Pontibacter sp. MBLB2868]|uniref:FAD-binding oxidoreductase n=1 Tax=Pontibacter sp. MBLB2868 TaxID=3451555 RepID=UPI003F74E73A